MGRVSWSNRSTVEDCLSLGISDMVRAGVFKKGPGILWTSRWANSRGEQTAALSYWLHSEPSGNLYLQLSYVITDCSTDIKPLDYSIELTSTPCNYGGTRYWFICPLLINDRTCGKRVGKLYLPERGEYFGCRACYNLTYKSCKEHDKKVDALVKNPGLLLNQMRNITIKNPFLFLRAYLRLERGK